MNSVIILFFQEVDEYLELYILEFDRNVIYNYL
jgi:hypothetical protein